jgi:hypothetical protein
VLIMIAGKMLGGAVFLELKRLQVPAK